MKSVNDEAELCCVQSTGTDPFTGLCILSGSLCLSLGEGEKRQLRKKLERDGEGRELKR